MWEVQHGKPELKIIFKMQALKGYERWRVKRKETGSEVTQRQEVINMYVPCMWMESQRAAAGSVRQCLIFEKI